MLKQAQHVLETYLGYRAVFYATGAEKPLGAAVAVAENGRFAGLKGVRVSLWRAVGTLPVFRWLWFVEDSAPWPGGEDDGVESRGLPYPFLLGTTTVRVRRVQGRCGCRYRAEFNQLTSPSAAHRRPSPDDTLDDRSHVVGGCGSETAHVRREHHRSRGE